MEKPFVSVVCDVYNHEPYLRQCLEGFVQQKTQFPFEILIHDDASTDKSADIIREYENNYPNLFRPIYETENQYHKQHLWADIQFPRAQGKYIAACEGDDYWTDPLKLQKQVDYMEAHAECSLCFGNAIEHWEDNLKTDKLFSEIEERDYLGVELSNKWIVPTASILFRRSVIETASFKRYTTDKKVLTGDLPLCLCCAEIGSLHAFTDVFCVYRRTTTGFWRSLDSTGRIKMGDERVELLRIFGKRYKNSTISMAFYHYQRAWQLAKQEQAPSKQRIAIYKIVRLAFCFPRLGFLHLLHILKERG